MQEGWICPRCRKVNALWMSQCTCSDSYYKYNYYDYNRITCIDNSTVSSLKDFFDKNN